MKRVEKQRKPLVLRVRSEGGTPSLQVVQEEAVARDFTQQEQEQEMESPEQNPVMEIPNNVDAIYVTREEKVTGPFTEKELRRHWANGVIYSDDFVWKEGMDDWVALGSYFGVPVLTSRSTSIAVLSQPNGNNRGGDGNGFSPQSWLVLPLVFSILSMCSALFFVFIIPENKIYFASACALTLVFALVVCIAGRKLYLVLLMMVNVLLPVLAWYYLIQNQEKTPPDNTVEQLEETLPASVIKEVASKKV
jgi:GYF domain 2